MTLELHWTPEEWNWLELCSAGFLLRVRVSSWLVSKGQYVCNSANSPTRPSQHQTQSSARSREVLHQKMRVLPVLLSSLPLLVTAVPTIIPIAVDQNLSPSTLDLSPDQLESNADLDPFSEPFNLDAPSPSPSYDQPPPPPPLVSPTSPGSGAQPCGLPEHPSCPEGQMCYRAAYDTECVQKKTCSAHAGVCKSKVGGLSGNLSTGNGKGSRKRPNAYPGYPNLGRFSGSWRGAN